MTLLQFLLLFPVSYSVRDRMENCIKARGNNTIGNVITFLSFHSFITYSQSIDDFILISNRASCINDDEKISLTSVILIRVQSSIYK